MTLREHLSQRPAADDLITIDVDLGTGRIIIKPMRRATWTLVTLVGILAFVLTALVGGKVFAGLRAVEILTFVLVGLIVIGLLGPKLWDRTMRHHTWSRDVIIQDRIVHCADRMGNRRENWEVSTDSYVGLAHRVVNHAAKSGGGRVAASGDHDVLELVHPEPGRTIPLYKRSKIDAPGAAQGDQVTTVQSFARVASRTFAVPLLGDLNTG